MNPYFTLIILILTVIALLLDKWRPSYVFGAAAILLLLSRQVSVQVFLTGYANPSILSIFLLITLTAVINENFKLMAFFDKLFASAQNASQFILRMGVSVAGLSSIMNNTPIVAMMIPYVYQWARKKKIAPSKLLIPLSFATILGGMITVIGTSTNLVLMGFIQEENAAPLSFPDFLIPGLLVSLAGIAFLSFFGNRLLPDNKDLVSDATQNFREFLAEIRISAEYPQIGQPVQKAGLRNLDGIFLVEIIRGNHVISPVSPDEQVLENDRLFFAGEGRKVAELVQSQKGMNIPAHAELARGNGMNILEAVVPANSQLIGSTLKELEFRENYDAAVIAIHRNGSQLRGKIGEIELDKGDMLLLSAGRTFISKNRAGKDIYLISEAKEIKDIPMRKKRLFWLFSSLIIGGALFSLYPLFTALVMLLGLSIIFKFTGYEHIKKNLSLDLLIILGSALALSNALISSGGAAWLGSRVTEISGKMEPLFIVLLSYFLTVLFTQFITNAAAIAIMFPIAYTLASQAGMDPRAVFIALAFGASCSFLTPVGYQTNLMVYGPGNYRARDFIRVGLPLTLLYSAIVLAWIVFRYL